MKGKMQYTKNQIINYLVDCIGYSEDQDLKGLKKNDLMDLVENEFSLNLFTNS